MGRIRILLAAVVLFLVIALGWTVGAAEIANANLQEDMHDMAAQGGAQIGLVDPSTDGDIPQLVARKAQAHGIYCSTATVLTTPTTAGT